MNFSAKDEAPSTMNGREYKITPEESMISINVKELWRYRELLFIFSWRDISVRYKQTALGIIWSVFQPLAGMAIFTFIFHRMAGIDSGDNTPYPIFLYVGLIFWHYFSGTLTRASESMVDNAAIIQKVYFPRLIIPASAAITELVDMLISAVVLAGMMLYYDIIPSFSGLLFLPILLICTMLSSLGIGLFCSALNIKYRDVRYALPFFIQMLMFVTPVIYPVKILEGHAIAKSLMLWLNPVSGIIDTARAALLGSRPVDWQIVIISLLMSSVIFLAGLYYFKSTERYFADIV